MKNLIGDWSGREVTVAIGGAKLLSVSGKAIRIDDAGILIEKSGGQVFFPVTSILYVTRDEDVGKTVAGL